MVNTRGIRVLGLEVTVTPAAVLVYLAVAVLAAGAAAWLRRLAPGPALLAGIFAASVLYGSEFLHQLGHALAARRAGYPMRGVHFFGLFAASIYPVDEPELPVRIHVQRALGGFWVNIVLGVALLPLSTYLWPISPLGGYVAAFSALINIFVLGLGAMLPIRVPGGSGLTDGATLLHLWRQSRARRGKGG
jgi:hypothetical protein